MIPLSSQDVEYYVQLTINPDSLSFPIDRTRPYCYIGKVVHLDSLQVILTPSDVYRPGGNHVNFVNTPETYLRVLQEEEARHSPNVLDLDELRASKASPDDLETRVDYIRGEVQNIVGVWKRRVINLKDIIGVTLL
ncbi:hypothetical protein HYV86_07420 [Candidatus Woesearchaeota archaeon]|nr:hypothetical protein [Candidatus Woesearchaeota archaeon]